MKTAIIYARVSTLKQADEGLPIDSQIEQCRAKAEQLGLEVVRVFKDEGISGRSSDRPAFQEAIDYCGLYSINSFICWNTARFARNRIDAAAYKAVLRKAGTRVVYVANDIDGESEEGWLLEGLVELMDEQYSRTVSKDTKRSMLKNAHDGYFNGGGVPFGYRSVPDGKRRRLQIDELEAPQVREVFHQYLSGAGSKSIAMALNASGRLRRGMLWKKQHVLYMLANWVYAGYVTFNKRNHATKKERPESEWIRTKSHEAIVSEDDFKQVQSTLEQRHGERTIEGGSPKSNYLFSGLLRCGTCNEGMQIETATGRSKVYSYYNCRGALRGTNCKNRRMSANELDTWLLQFMLDRILSPERIAEIVQEIYELKGTWVKDRDARRSALVSEMHTVERRRSRMYDILELHGRDAPNLKDIGLRLAAMNARIRDIEVALMELEKEPAPASRVSRSEMKAMSDYMRQVVEDCEDPKKVRHFLSTFTDKVVISAEHATIHYQPGKLGNLTLNALPPGQLPGGRFRIDEYWGASRRHSEPRIHVEILEADLPERFRRVA